MKKIKFKRGILENGLKVLVHEDHTNPIVAFTIFYEVGSRYEHIGITGVSHILEHMMYRGTKRIEPEAFSRIIGKLGGEDNAFTTKDFTAFYSIVPRDKIEIPIELESDRMYNLIFQGFEEELKVIKEERLWRTENNPFGLLWEKFWATAFEVHPYRNPVIGWMTDLENITLKAVKEFYQSFYTPRHAMTIFAGDITFEEALKLTEKYFTKGNKKSLEEPVIPEEPEQMGEKRVYLEKENGNPVIAVGYKIPQFSHPDNRVLTLLSDVLGDGKSSILMRKLVYEREVFSGITAENYALKDPGLFVIYGSPVNGMDVEKAEQELDRILNELKDLITEEDVQVAKNKALADFIFEQESVKNVGFSLGEFEILDRAECINLLPEKIMKVQLEDIKRAIDQYLVRKTRNVAILKVKK